MLYCPLFSLFHCSPSPFQLSPLLPPLYFLLQLSLEITSIDIHKSHISFAPLPLRPVVCCVRDLTAARERKMIRKKETSVSLSLPIPSSFYLPASSSLVSFSHSLFLSLPHLFFTLLFFTVLSCCSNKPVLCLILFNTAQHMVYTRVRR